MPLLLSIRVAEPWTSGAVLIAVALAIVVGGLVVWLVHRS